MTRFHGEIGYGTQTEISPGVVDDIITERTYSGDVTRLSKYNRPGESVNDDISLGHLIEIVADEFLAANFLAIRYVRWAGVLWKVSEVDIQHPRLVLRLGGAYHGPIPTPSGS